MISFVNNSDFFSFPTGGTDNGRRDSDAADASNYDCFACAFCFGLSLRLEPRKFPMFTKTIVGDNVDPVEFLLGTSNNLFERFDKPVGIFQYLFFDIKKQYGNIPLGYFDRFPIALKRTSNNSWKFTVAPYFFTTQSTWGSTNFCSPRKKIRVIGGEGG